ncbi:MAG: CHAD domain-containing protein [Cyanobacteria bacterium SZAS LIN-3]|nr:CHAD domain-containing protein [Cyanobacteria bacterium SZAS LIN-3]MBS2007296.1 CHAD domain-containing protein [Cyanobacteria bacterium SZAS TMP-1]
MPGHNIRAPEHLISYSCLELEKNQALLVFTDLEKLIGKLEKKLTEKRVHDARVALRRWYSVWDILALDGWEDSDYPDGGFEKSIGRKLRKLNKLLGGLRDIDVNLSLARDLHINQILVRRLYKERQELKREVEKKIGKLNLSKLISRLREYLAAKSETLEAAARTSMRSTNGLLSGAAGGSNGGTNGVSAGSVATIVAESDQHMLPDLSAYVHLSQFLGQAEHQCRLLCEHTKGMEELHELRLAIKRWRYLLSEFFGLTNLELVRAQQILGRIHDLYRLEEELDRLHKPLHKAIQRNRLAPEDLKADRAVIKAALDNQFELLEPVLAELPFGLRPYLASF